MRKIILSLFIIFYVVGIATFTLALPAGPETAISEIQSERSELWPAHTVTAVAGNITQFDTASSSITRSWQGYYGNITGMIILADSTNNTLYDWELAMPQGEIYAVSDGATVPDWYNVRCATPTELEAEDVRLNINETLDEDAVNRTFVVGGSPEAVVNNGGNPITHPLFYVSNVTIENDTCPVAAMYNSSRLPSPNFREVILSDQALFPIIYTGIIAHTINQFADSDGFDGSNYDFEMIVGEDGHGNDLATSTYWFYLELE